MTRFDTKPLKLGCGMVIDAGSILTIVLLVVAACTFGLSAANYHGNLVVMMFFSIVGVVIARLLLRLPSESNLNAFSQRGKVLSIARNSRKTPAHRRGSH